MGRHRAPAGTPLSRRAQRPIDRLRRAQHRAARPRRALLAVSTTAVAVGVGLAALGAVPDAAPGSSPSTTRGRPHATDSASARPTVALAPAAATSSAAAPTSVRIPEIGVDSTLVDLGRLPDGTLEVPTDFGTAGWYAAGPAPGDVGPAVIAGHLDSRNGPGVFARLPELVAGDQVEVGRADGSQVTFVVTRTEQVPKAQFPTDGVYGPVAGPELRLITCGGAFDHRTGHYVDNVLVFAREV